MICKYSYHLMYHSVSLENFRFDNLNGPSTDYVYAGNVNYSLYIEDIDLGVFYENQQSYVDGNFTTIISGSPTVNYTVIYSMTGLESTILSIDSSGSDNRFYIQAPDMNDTYDSIRYEYQFKTTVQDDNSIGKLFNI